MLKSINAGKPGCPTSDPHLGREDAQGSSRCLCVHPFGRKSLERVEHFDPEAYQKADSETVLFKLLDQRFPQKDSSDELSEILTEIFNLRVQEGESSLFGPRSRSVET